MTKFATIAVDSAGNAYIAGYSRVRGFPHGRGPSRQPFEVDALLIHLAPIALPLRQSSS